GVALITVVAWKDCSAGDEKIVAKDILECSSSMELHNVTIEGAVRQRERLSCHRRHRCAGSSLGRTD
ncbi:MAG: hypothetical protein OEV77_10905, partial [Nitrospira sp.]|nr:hypothetical protein [Nitrospira sp.]